VTGIERLRAALFRATLRHVVFNGNRISRVVPGTAADGLLLRIPTKADFPGPFSLDSGARAIAFVKDAGALSGIGPDDHFRLDFYAMPITPDRAASKIRKRLATAPRFADMP
jgi:hypothetical protein